MEKSSYVLKFNDVSALEANIYADELKSRLTYASDKIEVKRKKDDPNSQDLGGTLVLILGAPSVVVIARAIAKWLALRHSASIRIETIEGKVIANNITSSDATRIAELFRGSRRT